MAYTGEIISVVSLRTHTILEVSDYGGHAGSVILENNSCTYFYFVVPAVAYVGIVYPIWCRKANKTPTLSQFRPLAMAAVLAAIFGGKVVP